jgi:hypothetical protein
VSDRLPVWWTISRSLVACRRFVARYPGLSALLVALHFASQEASALGPTDSLRSLLWSCVSPVIVAALSAPIIVAAHRFVLTDDETGGYDLHSSRNATFMAAAVGYLLVFDTFFGVANWLIGQTHSALGWIPGAVLVIALCVVGVRTLLAFPLIAIDDPSPFRRSIALTRGLWWRIVTIEAIPLLAVAIVDASMTQIGIVSSMISTAPVVGSLAAALGEAFAYLMGPCTLSFIYLWIAKHEAGPAG